MGLLLYKDLTEVTPDPEPDTPAPKPPASDKPSPSNSGGNGGSGGISVYNYNFGVETNAGLKLKVKINGKETEVLLGLNNFTYAYAIPETVTAISGYNLRKGPEGSYGTCGRVKKGQALSIIGRDRDWLFVDLGDSKTGYILEGMTQKES